MSELSEAVAPSLDDLIATIVQARELIREAHGVIKDLRREITEARHIAGVAYDQALQASKAIEEDARARVQASMDAGVQLVEERMTSYIKLVAEGKPIRFTCSTPGCNQLLMGLDNGKPITCPSCGHRKLLTHDKEAGR